MNESSLLDKTTKIRAFIGAKTWEEIGKYLGNGESYILEIRTRYKPNEKNLLKINSNLDAFIQSFSVFLNYSLNYNFHNFSFYIIILTSFPLKLISLPLHLLL